tara:strand:- start:180 stop:911 length:732 start_codon:yes stop_codon:yes gene_type:complete
MKIISKYKKFFKKSISNFWGLSNVSTRNYFVKEWLLSLNKNSSILDAGAGIQRYKKYTKHLKYTSQDFGNYQGGDEFGTKNHPDWNSKNCDIICDIVNIPCNDSSFDYILCTEVFEHLPNPAEALKEFSRLLKSKGQILITAPFRCLYHQTPYFFYSGFSKYWYEYYGKEYQLDIKLIIANGNYFEEIGQEIFRIITFGNFIRRILSFFFSMPYLIYLFFIDKILKTKSPESCYGYHVIFTKK